MVQDLIGAHSLLNDPTIDFLPNINNDPNIVGGPYTISEFMDYISWIGLEKTQEYINDIFNNPAELNKKNYIEDAARNHYTHNCSF